MATRKRKLFRTFVVLMTVAGLIGAWLIYSTVWGKPVTLNLFFERVFARYALENPELLTTLRILEPMGIDFHNDDLTEASDAFHQRILVRALKDAEILKQYDRDIQTPSQQLSSDVLAWFLDDSARSLPYQYHDYPINQLQGVQSELPTFMATMHTIDDLKGARNYIARLKQFPWKFGQVLDSLQTRESKGILPPRFVVERVLTEMKGFTGEAPEKNILYTSADEKLSAVTAIPESERAALLAEIRDAIETSVYPSYTELIAYFDSLLPKTTTDDGAWKHPNGDAFYAHVLRSYTTTNLTPEEVHQIGLSEVTRVLDEMRGVLASVNVTGVEPGDALKTLAVEPRFLYPNTEEGKKECLADYQRIIDEIDGGMGAAFDLRPEAGVKVEPIPAFKEKTAPGAYYYPPAMDGSRPGIFYANMRNLAEVPKFGMRTLAYHEAVPGHHFQLAIQQELEDVPTFRKVLPFTAYVEGWALYAERLAWELGFEKDPYDNLGRLQGELFRSVRLVVDTGIHHKRWTREQAITYMRDTTGMPEGDVTAEIERYIVDPGQACAYKIGMMKILDLRERAKRELGEGFKPQEFHNVVLMNGALPLDILEQVVDRYIASKKG